jgi:MarR family 2-MHQ and catechol resistance regulon transcriptional repressor
MRQDRREDFYQKRVKESGPQYAGFDLASAEILLGLRFTEDVLQQACAPLLGEFGISKSSLNILMLLRHGPPEGMQLHDLGDLLLVSRANITGLIDHLEQREYVTRVVDQTDRRARFARITAKGVELLNTFMPMHYRNVRAMLHNLSDEEKKQLLGLLKKTRQSIAAHADQIQHSAVAELTNAE